MLSAPLRSVPLLAASLSVLIWSPAPAAGEIPAAGALDPRLESFDRLLRGFLARHGIPCASLAVTDRGRLVLARGYGVLDPKTGETVQPESLFRIASISKPITAVAVLHLVDAGKLRFEDRVSDVLPFAKWAEGGPAPDPRLAAVTIRHLLEHRGGWDRDASFDPMFRPVDFAEELGIPPPAPVLAVIRCMLRRPLDFDPGTRYAYSNYGYCLLGRAIEQVTGEPYESWVRERVLAPLGIRGMRLGRTRFEDRAPGEVRYHHPEEGDSCFVEDLGKKVPRTYGAFHLEAMDAHGGWLASAVDLARFACAFDDPADCPVLARETVEKMFARPSGATEGTAAAASEPAGAAASGESPPPVWYALGWQVRDAGGGRRNTWHGGSLPGTATLLVRRHDRRNWAVLLNSRASREGGNIAREIDRLLHEAADAVVEWPEHDLFAPARGARH